MSAHEGSGRIRYFSLGIGALSRNSEASEWPHDQLAAGAADQDLARSAASAPPGDDGDGLAALEVGVTLTKRFERLSFGAGVPPIRLHDTRHGAACLAHAAGASMKAIQALLRHASYSITADTYTTVFAELGDALAEDIASVVPRQRPVANSPKTAGLTTVSHLRKNG